MVLQMQFLKNSIIPWLCKFSTCSLLSRTVTN